MDPWLGAWIRTYHGKECAPDWNKNTMKLKELAQLVLPHRATHGMKHHTAGDDAQLHLVVYGAICKLAAEAAAVTA